MSFVGPIQKFKMLLQVPKSGLEKSFWPMLLFKNFLGYDIGSLEDDFQSRNLLQYSTGTSHMIFIIYLFFNHLRNLKFEKEDVSFQLMTALTHLGNGILFLVLVFKSVYSFHNEKRIFYNYLKNLDTKLEMFKTNQLLYDLFTVTMPLFLVCVADCFYSTYFFYTYFFNNPSYDLYFNAVRVVLNVTALDAACSMYFLSLALRFFNAKVKMCKQTKITAEQADLYKNCLSTIANTYATFEQLFRLKVSIYIKTIPLFYLLIKTFN